MILILAALTTPTAIAADEDPIRTAKQEALHEAAEILRAAGYSEGSEPIIALQELWWEEQEALNIIAKVVDGEARYCPWKHKVAVAAVVVNRVHSSYFPNNVYDVVAAPGQYTYLYLSGFENIGLECWQAAKTALDGTDDIPDDIIWQAEFPQGAEVWWKSFVDTGWYASTTYFCRGVYGGS